MLASRRWLPAPALLALTLAACPQPGTGSTSTGKAPEADKAPVDPEDDAARADGKAAAPPETGAAETGASSAPTSATLAADPEASKLGFSVARATVGHIGHFEDFKARMVLDDGAPTQLEISVDTGSVVADRKGLTSHLKSADFFHVDKFPTATFTADSFTPGPDEGENHYEISGTMRLHGVERKLKFPATIVVEDERVTGTATLDISAKAFGINYEGMEAELAEDSVQLEIELVFPRVAGG